MSKVSTTRHLELLAQLDEIGVKRREHLRLRAEAAELANRWVPEAIRAGVPIAEIARRAHLTRASVYTLKDGS
ncbi:MAG TPA: hypothetical protein VF257_04440 [Solirubrobacteraceae bacterium]